MAQFALKETLVRFEPLALHSSQPVLLHTRMVLAVKALNDHILQLKRKWILPYVLDYSKRSPKPKPVPLTS